MRMTKEILTFQSLVFEGTRHALFISLIKMLWCGSYTAILNQKVKANIQGIHIHVYYVSGSFLGRGNRIVKQKF